MQTGVRTDDSGFVFARPDGSPIHPDYFSQTFDRLLAKLDLPRIRLHDLRHTHATLLKASGIASVASLGGLFNALFMPDRRSGRGPERGLGRCVARS